MHTVDLSLHPLLLLMAVFPLCIVHRLNIELSRYQAKYRPVSHEVLQQLKGVDIVVAVLRIRR